MEVPTIYNAYKAYIRPKFQGISSQNMAFHGTDIPPFQDPGSFPLNFPVLIAQGTGLEADLPMLRVPEKVTNVGILMITGQRGPGLGDGEHRQVRS